MDPLFQRRAVYSKPNLDVIQRKGWFRFVGQRTLNASHFKHPDSTSFADLTDEANLWVRQFFQEACVYDGQLPANHDRDVLTDFTVPLVEVHQNKEKTKVIGYRLILLASTPLTLEAVEALEKKHNPALADQYKRRDQEQARLARLEARAAQQAARSSSRAQRGRPLPVDPDAEEESETRSVRPRREDEPLAPLVPTFYDSMHEFGLRLIQLENWRVMREYNKLDVTNGTTVKMMKSIFGSTMQKNMDKQLYAHLLLTTRIQEYSNFCGKYYASEWKTHFGPARGLETRALDWDRRPFDKILNQTVDPSTAKLTAETVHHAFSWLDAMTYHASTNPALACEYYDVRSYYAALSADKGLILPNTPAAAVTHILEQTDFEDAHVPVDPSSVLMATQREYYLKLRDTYPSLAKPGVEAPDAYPFPDLLFEVRHQPMGLWRPEVIMVQPLPVPLGAAPSDADDLSLDMSHLVAKYARELATMYMEQNRVRLPHQMRQRLEDTVQENNPRPDENNEPSLLEAAQDQAAMDQLAADAANWAARADEDVRVMDKRRVDQLSTDTRKLTRFYQLREKVAEKTLAARCMRNTGFFPLISSHPVRL
jgi:hypothetical protein